MNEIKHILLLDSSQASWVFLGNIRHQSEEVRERLGWSQILMVPCVLFHPSELQFPPL